MSFNDDIHDVEISFPKEPNGEALMKIGGVEIKRTCGIKIESAMWKGTVYPVVTVRFYARTVTGKVQGILNAEDRPGQRVDIDSQIPEDVIEKIEEKEKEPIRLIKRYS
jgi:hypothetical protein